MRMIDEAGEVWETEEPSAKPSPKVAAATVVGAPLAVVLAWLAGVLNVDMPAEVTAALAALLTAGVAYLKRDGSNIKWADSE